MQTLVVTIILAVAVVYAGWRIYRTVTYKGDACEGCALKESCAKHGGMKGNHDGCKNSDHRCPNC